MKLRKIRFVMALVIVASALHGAAASVQALDVIRDDIARIQSVGREGAGFSEAVAAAERLRGLPIDQLPLLLDAFQNTNPIAENWLRGLVQDVARRQAKLPVEALTEYVKDIKRSPEGRAVAMELIRQADPDRENRLVDQCLEDPSLSLRALAVERTIGRAKQAESDGNKDRAIELYQVALASARHPRQVESLIKSLKPLGKEVRPVDLFQFITTWRTVAPFSNVGGVGYDTAYPPEAQFAQGQPLDFKQPMEGKNGPVVWMELNTPADDGAVDLAKAYNKEKGAVCYALAELTVREAQPAQVRLGTSCANKVWVNGTLAMTNQIYHAGDLVDQYIADVQLKAGTNRLLLKICQNEQTEEWAQDWKFQFRVTDRTGKAIRE